MHLTLILLVVAASSAAAPPPNDHCEGALPFYTLPWNWQGSTAQATTDYVPSDCVGSACRGVWFAYLPSEDGVLAMSTLGSTYDTVLNVYSGTCQDLTYVACDDDSGGAKQALLAIPVTADTRYFILASGHDWDAATTISAGVAHSSVDSSGTDEARAPGRLLRVQAYTPGPPAIAGFYPCSGLPDDVIRIFGCSFLGATGTLSVRFNGVPAEFECRNALEIAARVPVGATTGPISVETLVGTAVSAHNFRVAGVLPPSIDSFSPPNGPPGTLVTILGSDFGGATCVKFNGVPACFRAVSASEIKATVPSGASTGRVEVITPLGSATSALDFAVEYPPENDGCGGAIVISPSSIPYTNTQDTTSATSTGDPVLSCDPAAGRGVWYVYTPDEDQAVVAHTYGSSFETSLAVYTGSCGALAEVACSSSGPGLASRLTLEASAGVAYHFLVAGKQGATGSLTFSMHADELVPHTDQWISANGGSWDNPENWAGGHVPGPTAEVVIDAPSSDTMPITLASSTTVRGLALGGGSGSGKVGLSIAPLVELVSTQDALIQPRGRIAVLGGSLTVTGNLENLGELILGSPTYIPPMGGRGGGGPGLKIAPDRALPSSVETTPGGTTAEMALVNITGGYIGQAGSSLTVRIASEDLYGRMSVNGQAKLTGSSLNLELLNGFVPGPDTPFDILVANHGPCEVSGGCSSPYCTICPTCAEGICGAFNTPINVTPALAAGYFDQQITSGPSPYFWCTTTSRDTVANPIVSQGELKTEPDGTSVDVALGIVTSVQPSANCIYLQHPTRSAALRVDTTATGQVIASKSVAYGDCLQVSGTMGTREILSESSERQIVASNLTRLTKVAQGSLTPLALQCQAVGGGAIEPYCPGVADGVGLNNLGLLVKILGRVMNVNGTDIIVDDSGEPYDPLGGVMVNLPGGSPAVREGSFVSIVGVVEGYVPAGETTDRPFVRPNAASDVGVLAY